MQKVGLASTARHPRILEVGCGRGDNVYTFAERGSHGAVGIDIVPDPSWCGMPGVPASFARATADALPFAESTFDAVYVKDTLHHVEDIPAVVSEIYRVVKPGGSLIVIEANRYHPVSYFTMVRMRGHEHFTRPRFAQIVAASPFGGSVTSTRQFEAHVIPVPWRWVRAVAEMCEDVFERVPLVKRASSYNLTVATKRSA